MRIFQEGNFGPCVSVRPLKMEAEAPCIANDQ